MTSDPRHAATGKHGEVRAIGVRMRAALPREPQYVPVLRSLIGCMLRDLGALPEDVDDLQLAVTEACANVVQHAEGTSEYAFSIEIGASCGEIEVVDLGPGFEASLTAPGEDAESGRGLLLIRALVDELEVVADDAATRIVLRKRWRCPLELMDAPADELSGGPEIGPDAVPEVLRDLIEATDPSALYATSGLGGHRVQPRSAVAGRAAAGERADRSGTGARHAMRSRPRPRSRVLDDAHVAAGSGDHEGSSASRP